MIPHGERRKAICFLSETHRDQRAPPSLLQKTSNNNTQVEMNSQLEKKIWKKMFGHSQLSDMSRMQHV